VPSYHATFTSDARSVALARTAIAKFAQLCGLTPAEVADVRTAAGEALLTAAKYSRIHRAGTFSINCTCGDEELRIDIQSSGGDAQAASEFSTTLMKTLMTTVTYSQGGTRVQLIKRR
jgi:anti-sigma regulatory factor (Ser/Thr protein kinase)